MVILDLVKNGKNQPSVSISWLFKSTSWPRLAYSINSHHKSASTNGPVTLAKWRLRPVDKTYERIHVIWPWALSPARASICGIVSRSCWPWNNKAVSSGVSGSETVAQAKMKEILLSILRKQSTYPRFTQTPFGTLAKPTHVLSTLVHSLKHVREQAMSIWGSCKW